MSWRNALAGTATPANSEKTARAGFETPTASTRWRTPSLRQAEGLEENLEVGDALPYAQPGGAYLQGIRFIDPRFLSSF